MKFGNIEAKTFGFVNKLSITKKTLYCYSSDVIGLVAGNRKVFFPWWRFGSVADFCFSFFIFFPYVLCSFFFFFFYFFSGYSVVIYFGKVRRNQTYFRSEKIYLEKKTMWVGNQRMPKLTLDHKYLRHNSLLEDWVFFFGYKHLFWNDIFTITLFTIFPLFKLTSVSLMVQLYT